MSSTPDQQRARAPRDVSNDGDDTSTTSSTPSTPSRIHPKKSQRTSSSAFDDDDDEDLDFEEMYAELEEKYDDLDRKYVELQEDNAALSLATGGEHAATIKGLKAEIKSYAILEKAYKKADKDKDDRLSAQEKYMKELKSSLKTADTKQAAAVKECADRYKTEIDDLKAEHDLKFKELKAEHKTVISELKKEQVERINELKSEHKKDLAREEARRKANVAEIEEKHKADVKEMKDKGVANVKEKMDEIAALKKSIVDSDRAAAKEELESQRFERAMKHGEIRAQQSVDAHAKKQYINQLVRQKNQEEIREKRSSLVSNMGGAGFLRMMERPTMLITNGDGQSNRGGGQRKSWYSSASYSASRNNDRTIVSSHYHDDSTISSRRHDDHTINSRRCDDHTISSRRHDDHTISSRRCDDRPTSSHHNHPRDTRHHEKENHTNSGRRSRRGIPSQVSLKSGYQGGEESSDAASDLEADVMALGGL